MADLTFYTNPRSRGRIARWALEEVGADYHTEYVGYGEEMKGDAYLAINPMGKVPAIVHDGQIVTECAAICAYLADAFPDAELAPKPHERASYFRWLFFAAGPLEQAIINTSSGFEFKGDQQAMSGYGTFEITRDTLIEAVASTPYVAGDRFTAADIYVGSQVGWGLQFGTIPTSPELEVYRDRVYARPAFLTANGLDDAAMA
ncbi:MAG: glutathione S-transferase family protein [Pseudomonadota bacterium]